MRRADRLLELVQILRDGRMHRARDMAATLGVSERTLYRDMETLMASGVPVAGARGEGYALTAPVTLPPLNLALAELEALHLGLALVGEAEDADLARAARSLAAKIEAVLPEDRASAPRGLAFATHPLTEAAHGFAHVPRLRAAIRARQKVAIEYAELDGVRSASTIRPLSLDFWGRVWTVAAWCERAADFRTFRADRITALRKVPQLFVDEPGKSLADLRARDPR